MSVGRYILVDGEPVEEPDLYKWGQWMETADRRVALHQLGQVEISTVFLGLDHGVGLDVVQVFETLVRGGLLSGQMYRYATLDEAAEGHLEVLQRVKELHGL